MSLQLQTAIVRIFNIKGVVVGTGFLVEEAIVLTCAHVVAGALRISEKELKQPDESIFLDFPFLAAGERRTARIRSWHPVQEHGGGDIAALQVDGPLPDGAQGVRLVATNDLWGHTFRAFGFPHAHDSGVWTSGRILAGEATGWIQIEDIKITGKRVQQGFSGAAILDEQLDGIVGMIVAADEDRSKVAYLIPTKCLLEQVPALDHSVIPPCPYRGLSAFREQDASFFFGRDRLTELLFSFLKKRSFVALIGASGSGKSSLFFAGLIPYLRSEECWHIIDFRPGANPFYAIVSSLLPLLEPTLSEVDRLGETSKLMGRLLRQEIELSVIVERIIQKYPGTHLLLAIDQFEELYTLCQEVEERKFFLDLLLSVIKSSSSSLVSHAKLVITLRSDFLSFLLSHPPFADVLQENILTIGAMTRKELQEILEKPAHKLNIKIEDGLAERILEEVEREPGSLPLLEFALTQLWAKQKNGRLTHAAYKESGGVEQALAVYAEEIYQQFSQEERQQAKQVFVQLVHPGEGTEDTRRIATRAELGEERWAIVMRLADARLVVSGRNELTGKETVEIVHEALIRGWKRLGTWIETNREFRIWQERLRTRLYEWEIHHRDNDTLLRGASLIEAESWLAQHTDALSESERAYIQKSLEQRRLQDAQERTRQAKMLSLQRRAVRRQRYVLGMMGVISIVLVIGLVVVTALYNSLQRENTALRISLPAAVTNLDDSGPGSLRQAIANATQGSTITFADGLRGKILLTTGELVITKNLIISGPGASALAISGDKKNRVFLVDRNVFVTISGLTIENGSATDISNGGGGIFLSSSTLLLINSIISGNTAPDQTSDGHKFYGYGGGIENQFGKLSLTNSSVFDNSATGYGGGIDNSGTVLLNNSFVLGNRTTFDGGGIFNDGTLNVNSSTISDNAATSGGGINNFLGDLILNDSTISDNSARNRGGGIEHEGPDNLNIQASTISGNKATIGGGIDNQYGELTLNNSTISDNFAQSKGGGIAISGRQAEITFCTIYGNRANVGGGISNEIASNGGVSLTTSIVAGNSAQNGPDVKGLLTLSYTNLIEDTSGATLTLVRISYDPTATESAKHSIFGKSPNVGPLQDNGGPTQTRALLPNSSAIDQVPLNECSYSPDQRGVKRPDGKENECDIGAYEYVD